MILACGTSWHAALVGKFLIESLARCRWTSTTAPSTDTAIRSSSRHTLAIVITQSGETADTLAALREAKKKGARSIAICNVVGSMATRETEGTVYTHAGPEIGVASTKAFTSQLVALHLVAVVPRADSRHAPVRRRAASSRRDHAASAPARADAEVRTGDRGNRRDASISAAISCISGAESTIPIALEGALKLKEISYIHAEGYPAGEMKHGPIALIDERMPVVAIAPHDHVFEKMIGNVQEAKARGGDGSCADRLPAGGVLHGLLDPAEDFLITIPESHPLLTPVLMVVPLQLLAYHIAVRRGCDVDQPRNLAKSVTVE